MQFFLLFLFIALFVFLFSLYTMGKDDMILLRRNIALEQLFNLTLVALAIGMFFSRFGFVLLHPDKKYLNPLVFLVFPYFPGLSLLTGMMGVVSYLLYMKIRKKIPFGRIMDFLSVALLTALPFGIWGNMFQSPRSMYIVLFISSLLYIFLAATFFTLLYPRLLVNDIKEGSISLLFLLIFSIIFLLQSIFLHVKGVWFFFGFEEIGVSILFFICMGLLIKQEILGKKHK